MKPLSLTLRGFRGIRDGLGRDELTLDFGRLADGAQLVAIAGANGRGKSTVIDNMHPYLAMPSRTDAGPGPFSWYDQVCLPESEKDLVWTHDGRRYRSHAIFRADGRRRTEAYLFVEGAAGWRPLRLDDGTVSDGRVDTHDRCVQAVLGDAGTFFTSVFSAQGKRQLSAYRNAEIKTLLADLLGLDEIRVLGQKGAEAAKLLKAGLAAMRREEAELDGALGLARTGRDRLGDAKARLDGAAAAMEAARQALDAARMAQTRLEEQQKQAQRHETARCGLFAERQAVLQSGGEAREVLDARQAREMQRLEQLARQIAERIVQAERLRDSLHERRSGLEQTLARAIWVAWAARRLPVAEKVAQQRAARAAELRRQAQRFAQLEGDEKAILQQLDGLEREAGQASLKAADLARRFGLTSEVPCHGTGLQGRCRLLGDAMDAKTLMPDASLHIATLARQRDGLNAELALLRAQSALLAGTPARLQAAERRLESARESATRMTVLAAQAGEVGRARAAMSELDAQLAALRELAFECEMAGKPAGETARESAERGQIADACRAIATQRTTQATQEREALLRIATAIAALPEPFDEPALKAAADAVDGAAGLLSRTEQAHAGALRDAQALDTENANILGLAARKGDIARRIGLVENGLGDWTLFARCMGNDGVIALAIDDAGPALSALPNALLLACYGARFTVSISTLIDTVKGGQREGFDIIVHDAETGGSKSVGLMSGGERVWINECLVRAVALHLAKNAGRQYETLFSDEADGPLDPQRKRMFIAMKREVLRLGGYGQEYFVSQTPELTAMADAVIDLDAMAAQGR